MRQNHCLVGGQGRRRSWPPAVGTSARCECSPRRKSPECFLKSSMHLLEQEPCLRNFCLRTLLQSRYWFWSNHYGAALELRVLHSACLAAWSLRGQKHQTYVGANLCQRSIRRKEIIRMGQFCLCYIADVESIPKNEGFRLFVYILLWKYNILLLLIMNVITHGIIQTK